MKLIDWDKPIKSKISNKPCEFVADSKLGNTKIVRMPDNTLIEVNPYGREVYLGKVHPEPSIVNYIEPKKIPITFDKIKGGAFFRYKDQGEYIILIPYQIAKDGLTCYAGVIMSYQFLMDNEYEYRLFTGGPWHPCCTVVNEDEITK